MRANMGIVASGQIPPVTTFTFDAETNGAATDTGPAGDKTWTHTPVGVPKGIVVLIAVENATGDQVGTVTYGGDTMTEVSGSPFAATLGSEEDCSLHGFVLTSSIPTGAQTVNITHTGGFGSLNAASFSVVGPNNTAVEDTSTVDGGPATNPTLALTINEDSFVCGVMVNSRDITGDVAVGAGMTSALTVDVGSQVVSFGYRAATTNTSSSVDWTVVSSRWAILAVALKST